MRSSNCRSVFGWGIVLLAGLLLCGGSSARGDGPYYTVEYPASKEPGELVFGVTYTIWIPEKAEKIRGIIVHQHGCGSGACKGGATAAYDLHWQALARKWDCALVGPSYHQEDGQNCRLWCDPRNGSSKTFLRSISDFAKMTKHPELESVPWCLWGHSGGGFWASLMQAEYPARIVAIWFRSGTAYSAWEKGDIPKPNLPPAAYEIPMIANPGGKERDDARFKGAWTGSMAMFQAYRAKGAPIAFAPDPRTAHECGDSRYLAIPFFDAALAARLPAPGSKDQTLRKVDMKAGWLAEPLSSTAVPAEKYTGKVDEACWLMNEQVAKAWSEYVTTGGVTDKTPPPAPTDVKVQVKEGLVEITWNATADFESGLQSFVIERDGTKVGELPEKPVGRFGKALFQTMSYHDTPEKPLPAMKFVDKQAMPGKPHSYRVIAVNAAGIKSEPSLAATVR